MAPRSIWKGSISFGLVNVPVALFPAVKDVDVHFHELHAEDHARVEVRRFCAEEDAEIPYEEIGRGYELEDGTLVVLTDEELDAVAPKRTRTIDIEAFVALADVDPVFFDAHYLLAPAGHGEGAQRAYALLVAALEGSGRAALGRFVLRTKEHLALLGVRSGRLALTTLRFATEVRPTDDVDADSARRATKARLEAAVAVIEELSTDWDPSAYRDEHRRRLQRAIKAKEQDGAVEVPKAEAEPKPAEDLLAALKASLAAVRA